MISIPDLKNLDYDNFVESIIMDLINCCNHDKQLLKELVDFLSKTHVEVELRQTLSTMLDNKIETILN